MSKFPVDAPKAKVVKTLERLGFVIVREREHIAMIREKNSSYNAESFDNKKFDIANYLYSGRNYKRRFFEDIQ